LRTVTVVLPRWMVIVSRTLSFFSWIE